MKAPMQDDRHNSLAAALRAMGRADTEAAPERVERALLGEMRAMRRKRQWMRAGVWLTAAAASLAIWGLFGPAEKVVEAPRPVALSVPVGTDEAPLPEAAVARPALVRPAVVGPADIRPAAAPKTRGAAKPRLAVEPERAFVPVGLWRGDEPMERATIVRVRLPKSALPAMGIPVSAERWGETVPAEVLLAEDGLVRAVRFDTPRRFE
jgi:hypothetical protein